MEPVIFILTLSWTAIEQLKNGSTVDLRTIRPLSAETARAAMGSYWQNLLLQNVWYQNRRTGRTCSSKMRIPGYRTSGSCDVPSVFQALMTLLRPFTPDIEQLSIDECFWTLHRSPINMNLRLPEPPLFLRLSKSNSALPLTSGSHRISCSLRWQVILKNQTASTRSGKKKSRKNSGRFLSRTFIW